MLEDLKIKERTFSDYIKILKDSLTYKTVLREGRKYEEFKSDLPLVNNIQKA